MPYKYLIIDADGNVYGTNEPKLARATYDKDDDQVLVDVEAGTYHFAGESRDVELLQP